MMLKIRPRQSDEVPGLAVTGFAFEIIVLGAYIAGIAATAPISHANLLAVAGIHGGARHGPML
jgi:hypothetical protein